MKNKTGFTIIELVTAMAILAIIGMSLSIMMRQMTGTYMRIRAGQEILDDARTIISMLTSDIENAYVSKTDNRYQFHATSTALDFNAVCEQTIGQHEVVEVGYATNGTNLEKRLETGSAIPNDVKTGGTVNILCDNVTTLSFRFMYKDSAGDFQHTASDWDSNADDIQNYDRSGNEKNPDGLPDAVEINFTVQDETGKKQKSFKTKVFLVSLT